MHKGKYVFAQLLDFIDKDVFLRLANKYDGNRYVKQFTCWNQLAVLMFGQLSNFDENDFIKVIVSYCNLGNCKGFTNRFWQLYLFYKRQRQCCVALPLL